MVRIVSSLDQAGVDEYYIATSAGLDGPRRVYDLSRRLIEEFPSMKLGLHLHNTNGMALANALAAMEAGVRTFEGALSGIGGGIRLPEGSGNHGNVALEDLVNMFEEMGVATGIDLEAVVRASREVANLLEVPLASYATTGGTKALSDER